MSIRSMLLKANHKITLMRPIKGRTPMGGTGGQTSLQPLRILQPVWVQPAASDVVQSYGANEIRVTHRIYCDHDPQALLEDVVTFQERRMTVRGVINNLELNNLWYLDVED